MSTQATAQRNGIDFLISQHEQVKTLLSTIESASPASRQESFDELRRMLAVHETAEELVLRPMTRADVADGDTIADARMAEENLAKETLSELEKLDASTEEFASAFARFAEDVRKHAQNEETYEFPLVREAEDEGRLGALGERLQAAEEAAPTHPHPSARTTTANAVLGPFAAIADKVRDALSRR